MNGFCDFTKMVALRYIIMSHFSYNSTFGHVNITITNTEQYEIFIHVLIAKCMDMFLLALTSISPRGSYNHVFEL